MEILRPAPELSIGKRKRTELEGEESCKGSSEKSSPILWKSLTRECDRGKV